MEKINYDKIFSETVKGLNGEKKKLLLHSCCAPCSSTCLERLKEQFEISVFYYNPNIDDEEEYEKRKAEQVRFLALTDSGKLVDCAHDKQAFTKMSQGLENEPERGKRCYLCYELRLRETARVAKELGFSWFCTTLSLSPYKNAEWLNEIGVRVGEEYGVNYLVSDFKKRGGYLRSVELSEEYGLYRQDFCGCEFSKRQRERETLSKREKSEQEEEKNCR